MIEDKNYSQIKIDLFTATIRKQIDGFLRKRKDLVNKTVNKADEVKKLLDLN